MNSRALRRWIAPLRRKVQGMVRRCVLRAVDDAPKLQELTVATMAETLRSGVERVQEYGFTSRPFAGAEAVVLFPGGDQDHGIVVAVDDRRYRISLLEGEVALYDDLGQYVKLQRSGDVTVKANQTVVLSAPQTTVTGDLRVEGESTFLADVDVQADLDAEDVTATTPGVSISAIKNAYNPHTHPGGGAPDVQL